jgi:prepilin-type N-terminal cleavage/methylation domain-containing protein
MNRRGLTLVELLMTITVLGMVASMVLPLLGDGAAGRIGVASILLRDDLEQARFRTVANPERPLAVVVADDGAGWMVVDPAMPGTPATRDDGTPWIIRAGEERAAGMEDVFIALEGTSESLLDFDESGAVRDRSATPSFRITCGERVRIIEVGAVTGLVRIHNEE